MTQETVSPRGGSHAVRAARRDEAALLGEVLADAFAEDPVFAWLIPPHLRGRDTRMRTFFTSMSRSYLRRGKPCYLTGDASAAACGPRREPGRCRSARSSWRRRPTDWPCAAACSAGCGRNCRSNAFTPGRLRRTGTSATSAPAATGRARGLGAQMLRAVLAGADAAGLPAYLESSSERNLPLYERNGFRVIGELRALGHGPTLWCMWREPPPRT